MKKAILAFAMAAVAVSCAQASEEAVVETADSTATGLDSLEAAAYGDSTVAAEGEEASAE